MTSVKMAYLWCVVLVSLAAMAGPSLAATTMSRELAELLIQMTKEIGHTPADRDDLPPLPTGGNEAKADIPELPPTGPEGRDDDEPDDFTDLAGVKEGEEDFSDTLNERIFDKEYHIGPTPEQIVAKLGNKDLLHMDRKSAEQHLKNRTEGLERTDYLWTIDEALEEMRRERGEEFYRDFRRETRKHTRGNNKMFICFFCDETCDKEATSSYGGPKGMETIIAQMFAQLNLEAKVGLIMKPKKKIPYPIYLKGELNDRGVKDIARMSENFWEYKGFYQKAMGVGCDANVLSVDDDNSLFKYINKVIGVAGMFQMCIKSYSVCQVSDSLKVSATVVGHEIGHLLGASHDTGVIESSFTNPTLMALLSQSAQDKIKTHCAKQDSGCAQGRYKCIMASSSSGQTKFSKCSEGYYEAYRSLASRDDFTEYYNQTCLIDNTDPNRED